MVRKEEEAKIGLPKIDMEALKAITKKVIDYRPLQAAYYSVNWR